MSGLTRSITTAAKMWCGATAFFFAAFLFAYFYLRSLDPNNSWTIGKHVSPSGGLGVTVMACFLLSGLLLWLGSRRPVDQISTGVVAILLALCGVDSSSSSTRILGFGPTSGGYASVFFGWTATYAAGALWGIYWMEISVASIWRNKRDGGGAREDLLQAGYTACTICWTFFVAIGVIMFVVLYLV